MISACCRILSVFIVSAYDGRVSSRNVIRVSPDGRSMTVCWCLSKVSGVHDFYKYEGIQDNDDNVRKQINQYLSVHLVCCKINLISSQAGSCNHS